MNKQYRTALSGAFGFYFKKQRKGFFIAAIGLFLFTNLLCLPFGFAIQEIQQILKEKDQTTYDSAFVTRLWDAGQRKIEREKNQ